MPRSHPSDARTRRPQRAPGGADARRLAACSALLVLGSLLGTSGGCSIGRATPCECPVPDVPGPPVCTAQDVAESEDADHRGRWNRIDPEAGPALATLETSASPREIGLDALLACIAAARVVFVPDVHDDARRHAAFGRMLSYLAARTDAVGRFDSLGLEFVYSGWPDLPPDALRLVVGAHFALSSDKDGETHTIAAWTTEYVEEAHALGWTVTALNHERFNRIAVPVFPVPHPEPPPYEIPVLPGIIPLSHDAEFTRRMNERDAWVVEVLNATPDRLIVLYGRDHVLSGRITSTVRGALVIVPYDRELWRIACDRLDLSARPATEPLAIELSAGIFLFHLGIARDASAPRARPEQRLRNVPLRHASSELGGSSR